MYHGKLRLNLVSPSNKIFTEYILMFQVSSGKTETTPHKPVASSQMQYLLQPPPPQVLVIERMHSGKITTC